MCARKDCPTGLPATRKCGGKVPRYCDLCAKIVEARATACKKGKAVPSWSDAVGLIPLDMKCPCCNFEMTLHKEYAGLHRTMSLQHWKDGRIGWVCQSCNSRMKTTEELPPEGTRRCGDCAEVKPLDAFYASRSSTSHTKLMTKCIECAKLRSAAQWERKKLAARADARIV